MLFSSMIEAAQNSPFKKPFSTASCEPAMEKGQLTEHHHIQAAATAEGGEYLTNRKYKLQLQ